MSERGSYITEYIYCNKCFDAIDQILTSEKIGPMARLCASIIAGKVGGAANGDELTNFESRYIPKLEQVICHPLRIAVLAEEGQEIFTVTPGGTPA